MDTDKRMASESLPNDIMLSSAEDLNNDGSFMGGGEDPLHGEDWEDARLDQAVAELMESEESEDAMIEPEEVATRPEHPAAQPEHAAAQPEHYNIARPAHMMPRPERREAPRPQKPVVMMPDPMMRAVRCECPDDTLAERPLDQAEPMTRPEPVRTHSEHRVGVNKAALIWMVILTIVLGGVIGIMIYAFIIDRIDATQAPEPDPDSSLQENLNTVAGALEVYLTEVNLDNYNTDIVLVNGGGAVSLKGTLRHSVFINATSAITLVLNEVTVEPEEGAAIVNLNSSALTLRIDGMNTLLADGGSYGAALYSNGSLTIRGDGQIMIYASGAGSRAITTKNGYRIDGGAVVALGQSGIERPLDSSTQAYFTKDLAQLYKKGTLVSASNEAGEQVVRFTAPGDFSSIFVSNSKLADGVQYSISLGGSGAD